MKVMVTLIGPFTGMGDIDKAGQRSITLGVLDARDMPRRVAEWVFDQVAHMVGVDDPEPFTEDCPDCDGTGGDGGEGDCGSCLGDGVLRREDYAKALTRKVKHPDIIPDHAPDDPQLWEDLSDAA